MTEVPIIKGNPWFYKDGTGLFKISIEEKPELVKFEDKYYKITHWYRGEYFIGEPIEDSGTQE